MRRLPPFRFDPGATRRLGKHSELGLSFHLRWPALALPMEHSQQDKITQGSRALEADQQQPQHPKDMKIWFNELLQNAAFPAMVLAFACSLINNEIPDVCKDSTTADYRRSAETLITYGERLATEDGAGRGQSLP
jgi:hypothetical protein